MGKKYFNKTKFYYGYRGEILFEQLVPGCKKQSRQADYKYKDLQVEIGRSKTISYKRFKVYFRKLFYNVHKQHHEFLKEKNPHHVRDFVLENKNNSDYFLVDFDKFIFVYFTNSLKKCAIFTYQDILNSELKKGYKGEYAFDMKMKYLFDITEVLPILDNISDVSNSNVIDNNKLDFGEVVLQ